MTDLKKIKAFVIVSILFLIAINFVSAVTFCDTIYVSQTWEQGQSTQRTITCTNQNNSTSVTMNKFGSFFSTAPSIPITLLPLTPKNIIMSFDSNAPVGNYDGVLYFSDDSDPIILNMTVTNPIVSDTDLIVFPTSKVINVKQGNEKTQNILISVPQSYPRVVTINAVNFNPGTETIRFGDLNLGQVAPGSSIQIPIIFSGVDAETGTYQTDLSILAIDSEGQVALPKISLTLQITAGVSPITEETFSTPPSCALSATVLNLNISYSFICSGVVSNLEIDIPSSEYFIGKNVEITSGIYKYEFISVKYGETQFKADFKYKGASIFEPFKQDIKISSAGSLVAGTNLKFIFTPSLEDAKTGESTLIQLTDNKTGSLISDPRILINAKEINRTGDFSFEYLFDTDKTYELRGKAPGYEDLVQTISVSPKDIEIYINPNSGDVNTMFNITTSVPNATLTIRGRDYENNYYGSLPAGELEIKGSKIGYNSNTINLTIGDTYRIIEGGSDFKLREEQNLILNKNATTIRVLYLKDIQQDRGTAEEYYVTTGKSLTFTPKKNGIYIIQADGVNIGTFEVKGFSFLNKLWIFPVWGWILGLVFITGSILLYIRKRNLQKYNPQDEAGLTYPVGDAL